jgi:Escherichia/Staphylococcus phage prohead protease
MLQSEPGVASVFAPRTTIDADGTVEGYASLFGEIDQARDMVVRGAFRHTLATRGVRRIPMLFQHDPSEPVGIWLELREDHRGLFARGRLIPEVARGRELLSLLRAGAIDGLSIGFRTAKARIDPGTRVRRLLALDLWEISIVTFPMLTGARVSTVKQAAAAKLSAVPSHARTRAEREWKKLAGQPLPTSRLAPKAPIDRRGAGQGPIADGPHRRRASNSTLPISLPHPSGAPACSFARPHRTPSPE